MTATADEEPVLNLTVQPVVGRRACQHHSSPRTPKGTSPGQGRNRQRPFNRFSRSCGHGKSRDINSTMTTQQLHLFNCLYLVMLIAVAILTRATPRRIAGALAGAAVEIPGLRNPSAPLCEICRDGGSQWTGRGGDEPRLRDAASRLKNSPPLMSWSISITNSWP
jgi:hypothetical protein